MKMKKNMPIELPNSENNEIKYAEIAELEEPFKKIIKEMAGRVEKGEYDLIVGIDASGRISALILEKFIKHIYSEKGLVIFRSHGII